MKQTNEGNLLHPQLEFIKRKYGMDMGEHQKEHAKRLAPFKNVLESIKSVSATKMNGIFKKKQELLTGMHSQRAQAQNAAMKPIIDFINAGNGHISHPINNSNKIETSRQLISSQFDAVPMEFTTTHIPDLSGMPDSAYNHFDIFWPAQISDSPFLYADSAAVPANADPDDIHASKSTGDMHVYVHVDGSGNAFGGAGISMFYMPPADLEYFQVRPYCSFDYGAIAEAWMGGTAHSDGSFEMYIWSFDENGNDSVLEHKSVQKCWGFGSSFLDSWNADFGSGMAFTNSNLPNGIWTRKGRIYQICIWAVCSCDAGVFSWGEITALLHWVVVAGVKTSGVVPH